MENRLSSNYLYHYKKDINVVELIIKNGFRYNLWEEKVIFKDSVQQNFMVCFCDILTEQADYHKSCYGSIAIVLTKEWGIQNNISPVRYVHKNSAGQNHEYIKIKNIFRKIKDESNNNSLIFACDYLMMSLLKYNGQMTKPSIQASMNDNSDWNKYLQELSDEYEAFVAKLTKSGRKKYLECFYKYLNCFYNSLAELHNELEQRDALMRVYQDDFGNIKDKVLYDEREWRSIPDLSGIDYQQAIKDKHLPEQYNLKFKSDDLVAILVDNQEQADELINFIQSNNTLLDKNKDLSKIQLFNNFKEYDNE